MGQTLTQVGVVLGATGLPWRLVSARFDVVDTKIDGVEQRLDAKIDGLAGRSA